MDKNIDLITYKNTQWWIHDNERKYFFDVVCLSKKIIIEFNGDYWHCNPLLYDENYYHKLWKKRAKEIWKQDSIKINVAKKYGFKILIIWENDYKNNKEEILNICINFFNQNI